MLECGCKVCLSSFLRMSDTFIEVICLFRAINRRARDRMKVNALNWLYTSAIQYLDINDRAKHWYLDIKDWLDTGESITIVSTVSAITALGNKNLGDVSGTMTTVYKVCAMVIKFTVFFSVSGVLIAVFCKFSTLENRIKMPPKWHPVPYSALRSTSALWALVKSSAL